VPILCIFVLVSAHCYSCLFLDAFSVHPYMSVWHVFMSCNRLWPIANRVVDRAVKLDRQTIPVLICLSVATESCVKVFCCCIYSCAMPCVMAFCKPVGPGL